MKDWIYDTECYPNCFIYVGKNTETKEVRLYQVSPIADQRIALLTHLRNEVGMMIGFNNLFYDCPMLHYAITKLYPKKLKGRDFCKIMKEYSNKLIDNNAKPWTNYVKNPFRKQMDLYKIHHFDNKAKNTGLKSLMFVMKMIDIEELPYDPDKILTEEEILHLIEYCKKDVEATFKFYIESLDAIKFRQRMQNRYMIDFTNANDVKIGELILINAIADKMNVSYSEISGMRTKRGDMPIREIIFPYVQFSSEVLNVFTRWWKTKDIHKTTGEFSEIPLEEVEGIFQYTDKKLKKGKLKKLNVIYKGLQFDIGTGGLHAYQKDKKTGIWEADDEYCMDLFDVSSYYPRMAFSNKLAPAHFPVEIFIAVIDMLYLQRMEGAATGDKEIVKAIKLALNGALYGKSNSEFSAMFDPLFMMKICLNGQLLLMMIAEKSLDEDIEVIQANTDGIMIRYHKSKAQFVKNLVTRWMNLTGLQLGLESYKKFIQRDVNNYLGIKTDGKIKRKGVFLIEREWHQNHSQLVVAKAIEDHYINGTSPETFISNHLENNQNLYDFFKLAKIQRNHSILQRKQFDNLLMYPTKTKRMKKWTITCIEEGKQLQNITRYYVAMQGYKLIKIMPPLEGKIFNREEEIEAGNLCIECNNLNLVTPQQVRDNIDINYYIREAYKIINAIAQGIETELQTD